MGSRTRNGILEFGRQGKFQFRFAYNEILANTSDSFQTPYLGVGTDNSDIAIQLDRADFAAKERHRSELLRAQSGDCEPAVSTTKRGVLTPPTLAQLDTMAAIRAADLPAFQNVNLSLTRKRGEAQLLFIPTEMIDIPVSYSHEHKDGLRTVGGVNDQNTQDSALLPYRVNWDTDQASAAVNVKRNKLFLSFAYYGSFFRNNTEHMIWADPANSRPHVGSGGRTRAPSSTSSRQRAAINSRGMPSLWSWVRLAAEPRTRRLLTRRLVQKEQLPFGLPRPSLAESCVHRAWLRQVHRETRQVGLHRLISGSTIAIIRRPVSIYPVPG